MSDNFDSVDLNGEALLKRVDVLLGRQKSVVSSKTEIPLLTEIAARPVSVSEATIPTLTDILPSTAMRPTSSSQMPFEQAVYRKLRRHVDREIAGLTLLPETVVALDQALRRASSELKEDLEVMARTERAIARSDESTRSTFDK